MTSERIADVLRRFEEDHLSFPPFGVAVRAVECQLQLYRDSGIAQNLLILGESGTGKSTLCRLIKQKFPRFETADRDIVPALVVSIPPIATIPSVAEAMLQELGDPLGYSGSTTAKTARVVTLCKACGVELVLFDEAQHIQDRGQTYTHYLVGDWLKSLIDGLAVPTAFLALPRFEEILKVNEQLRRRFSRRLRLELGQTDGQTIQDECFDLFHGLASCLPIPLTYGSYGREEMGLRLYYATDGRVAYLKKLLSAALVHAHNLGQSRIDPGLLEASFTSDLWWEGVRELNPFHSSFAFRKLDRGGEPFERGRVGAPKR